MKRIRKQRTLKNEILFNDLFVIMIIFFVIMLSIIGIYVDTFYKEINLKNQTLATSLAYQINEHSEIHINTLSYFAYNYENHLLSENITPNDLLMNLKSQDAMFEKIQILNVDGLVTHSSDENQRDIGFDLSKQPYIASLTTPGSREFSTSFLSKDLGKIVTSFSMRTEDHYYVALLNLEHFNDHLLSLSEDESVKYLILDKNNTIISASNTQLVETRTKLNFLETIDIWWGPELIVIDGVKYLSNRSISDVMKWHVIILNEYDSILKPIYQVTVASLGIALFLLTFYFVFKQRRFIRISDTLEDLQDNFERIAQGQYDLQMTTETYEEFNDLSSHFAQAAEEIENREEEILSLNETLESQVEKRTEELTVKNEELNALLEELKGTQSMLIESEKLASFSRLIAGVAHEINTPIGVGVTSSSYLNANVKRIKEAYLEGNLSKTEFEESINEIDELSDMILKNLLRAGDLITSFKKASGDSFYDDMTEYNLYDLANNLIKSMKLKFQDTVYYIDLDIPSDLIIKSYPSSMSQILTNLITNSIHHGFKDLKEGHISIKATNTDKNWVKLEYSDDGHGITLDQFDHIFEPFYTTNRSGGGTGLGLSIIKNLIINKLQGTIDVSSTPGESTKFIVTFPRTLQDPRFEI